MADPAAYLSHALQDVYVHFGGQVLRIETIDHLDASASVPGKGEQAHILPLNEPKHDRRMTKRIQRARLARRRLV